MSLFPLSGSLAPLTRPFAMPSTVIATDPVVADWVNRVYANNGYLYGSTITAVQTFVTTLRNDASGVWTAMTAGNTGRLNLFAGANLNSSLVPLLKGAGGITDLNPGGLPFTDSEYAENVGLQAAGSNRRYLDTGLPGNSFGADNITLLFRASSVVALARVIGTATAPSLTNMAWLDSPTTTSLRARINATSSIIASATITNTASTLTAVASSFTDLKLYQNSTQVGTLATLRSNPLSINPFYVFNANQGNGSVSTPNAFTSTATAYFIGPKISATQLAVLIAALDTLNTTLGR